MYAYIMNKVTLYIMYSTDIWAFTLSLQLF